MKGTMDQLAKDLATGKIKITEAEKEKKKAAVVPETDRINVLVKKHEDQAKLNSRSAQEALALQKHHRERGEHEMANIHKALVLPYQTCAAQHKKLAAHYTKRRKT